MYVIRIQVKPKTLSSFPQNWARVSSDVLSLMTKDSFQFNQLQRHKNVLHLTQLNLVTGEISCYSSFQCDEGRM